jgi:hypothetical protein
MLKYYSIAFCNTFLCAVFIKCSLKIKYLTYTLSVLCWELRYTLRRHRQGPFVEQTEYMW